MIEISKQSSSTTVSVTVRPDASARVAALGMQTELQQMIDHVRQVVPDLEAVEVEIAERYDLGGEPGVSVIAYSDRPFLPDDTTSWQIRRWAVENFPPQVLEHLCILLTPGRPNAG
jgi:hypothetical protein